MHRTSELRDPLALAARCLRLASSVPDAAMAAEMRNMAGELHRLAAELEAMTMHLDAVALRHAIAEPSARVAMVH